MAMLNVSAPVTCAMAGCAEEEGVLECGTRLIVPGEVAEPEAVVPALAAKPVDLVPAQRGPYYDVGLQTGVDQIWCVLRSCGNKTFNKELKGESTNL